MAEQTTQGQKRPDGMPVGRPFPKGVSGHTGHLKKKVRALLKGHEAEWVDALVRDLTGKRGPESTAAQKLYAAYRWGKPTEAIQLDGTGVIQVNIVIPSAEPPP